MGGDWNGSYAISGSGGVGVEAVSGFGTGFVGAGSGVRDPQTSSISAIDIFSYNKIENMFTQYLIILVGICILITLSYYIYVGMGQYRESFDSKPPINAGSDPQIKGKPYDYLY